MIDYDNSEIFLSELIVAAQDGQEPFRTHAKYTVIIINMTDYC